MSSEDHLMTAGRITLTFLFLYTATDINLLVTKRRLLAQAQREGNKPFNRYTSPQMHNADRLQANFLEWSPVFLGLLWSLASTNNLTLAASIGGWLYVGFRVLYFILILKYGVALDGRNYALYIATFPAYFCLIFLFGKATQSFWLQ